MCGSTHQGITTAGGRLGAPTAVPAPGFRGSSPARGSICGWVWGRVLFSESPPLKRKDSGETPY